MQAQQQQDYPIPGVYDKTLFSEKPDSATIHELLKQGYALVYKQPDSAIPIFKKAIEYSRHNGYYIGISRALINIAACHLVKDDYYQAIHFLTMAVPFCIILGDNRQKELADLCINMSVAYFHLGKNDSALAYLFKGLDVAAKNRDTAQMIHLNANIAGLWAHNGQHARSVYYASEGIRLAISKNDFSHLPQLYGIMAANSKGDKRRSLEYLRKAFQLAASEQQKTEVLTKAGEIYLQNEMPDSAIYYLHKRLALVNPKSNFRRFDIYSNLATAYHLLKKEDTALHYMQQALRLAEASGKRNLNLAVTWYNMAEILMSMERHKEATRYLIPYTELRDSLLAVERNRAFDLLDVKYRTAEKDKKIMAQQLQLAQEQQKAARKNIWAAGIIACLTFIIAFGFVFYRNLRHKQRHQQNELLLLQQQKELALLKASMKGEEKERTRIAYDLHDGIGGMLAAIKMNFGAVQERYEALYGLEELNPIMRMVEDTTDELRKTVQNLIPGVLLKHSLSEALRIYCSNINASGKLHISLQLYGQFDNLSKDFELMLYRIVQELIQNMIKHAQCTEAVVELERKDNKIHILAEDNGIGFDTTTSRKGGFGLENLRFRVQALQGYISIESARERGTTINITFDDEKVKTAFA